MRSISGRSPKRRIRRNAARPTVNRTGASQRTGTVMVFVLGILTLLALIGIGLIASTRMDAKRVDNQSNVTSTTDSINSVVKQIQETLREDIWGASNSTVPLNNSTPTGVADPYAPGQPSNPLGIHEYNEPYDAPGASDRWLSTLMPYSRAVVVVDPASTSLHTGNAADQISPGLGEKDVLVWPEVSYLGSDLLLPKVNTGGGSRNEFAWPFNTRNAPVILSFSSLVRYGPTNELPTSVNYSLKDVPVMQTWPPRPGTLVNGADGDWVYEQGTGPAYPMVPGSTTNVTIRRAQTRWNELASLFGSAALPPGFTPKFPYFDTNGDGIPDLYDADGDGVPDSPISFVLDGNSSNPQSPSKLYAVIRVVDHGGMLNANVASSFAFSQNPPTNLMFDESNANLQRRGRRATELMLDDVCHKGDINGLGISNRAWQLVNYRTRNATNAAWVNDPFFYDINVARRDLIGGLSANLGYRLFGLGDEASLRHRFSLVPSAYANYTKAPPSNGVGYDKIDTALPWSTLWSTTLTNTPVTNSYERNSSRWSRFNADFEAYSTSPPSGYNYEGFDNATNGTLGWRKMLTEDEPYSIRRPMFTTISREVMLPPTDLAYNSAAGLTQLPAAGAYPVNWLVFGSAPEPMDMNAPADPWPMVASTISVPDWMRILPLDVNMTGDSATATAVHALQAKYMKYMASAMFIALGGVTDASGLNTTALADRLSYAWQFAANIGDYRDSDGVPTAIQLPNGDIAHGLEKQPFFTEAYCRVEYHNEDQAQTPTQRASDDDWFDAVELYVPPTWLVNITNLYIRTPGPGSSIPTLAGIPLASFMKAGAPPVLDGNGLSLSTGNINTSGAYFVLCGPTTAAPATFTSGLTPALAFYSYAGFKPDHDTSSLTAGKVELVYSEDPTNPLSPSTHVLDTIDFARNGNTTSGNGITIGSGPGTGGPGTGPGPGSGNTFRWAQRDGSNPGPDPNSNERFSMARSTEGWRFTIACFQYLYKNPAGGQPNFETLGLANTGQIDPTVAFNELPEMPWPTRSKRDHTDGTSEVPGGFATGSPYEAFDSVIDISRIPMVANLVRAPGSTLLPYLPATQMFWEMINKQRNVTTGNGPQLAVAAAHIDFVNADKVSMIAPPFLTLGTGPTTTGPVQPWTWRLLRYLTAIGHGSDRIDNDGDGTVNNINGNEGPNTLFRVAGRINVNTAPVTVLRTVPSMSLLPDSMQFSQLMALSGDTTRANAANTDAYTYYASTYSADRTQFWDFASAIVAAREGRDVIVRQADLNGDMQQVAVCHPGAAGTRVYENLGELMDALCTKPGTQNLTDTGGNNYMFRADRYTDKASNIPLTSHRAGVNGDLGMGTVAPSPDYRAFSPDYRYRKPEGSQVETFDFTPVGAGDASPSTTYSQSGGIRGRDIFLSRWANVLTTRSDVFTAYIALIDEDGKYVRRAQVTFDRSNCFGEQRTGGGPSKAVLPDILLREEGSYTDDSR